MHLSPSSYQPTFNRAALPAAGVPGTRAQVANPSDSTPSAPQFSGMSNRAKKWTAAVALMLSGLGFSATSQTITDQRLVEFEQTAVQETSRDLHLPDILDVIGAGLGGGGGWMAASLLGPSIIRRKQNQEAQQNTTSPASSAPPPPDENNPPAPKEERGLL